MRAIEGVIVLAYTVDISFIKLKSKSAAACGDSFLMDSQNELIPDIARLEIFAPGRPFLKSLVKSDESSNQETFLAYVIRNAETELELIMADSEPAKNRAPQKCGNCRREGHTARTCTKGVTHVRSDALPLTAL
jgi:hypothetical protein